MFLVFSCFNNFIHFQMKSVFLNDYILEEVYIKQSLGFKSHNFLNYILSLKRLCMVLSKNLKLGMRD
jgi:hypothetical protein